MRIDEEGEDLEGWTEIVTRMQSYGAQLSGPARPALMAYLAAIHGADQAADDHGRGRGRGRGGGDGAVDD